MQNCEHDWSSGLWAVAYTIDPNTENQSGTEQPKKVPLDRCLRCGLLRIFQDGTPVKHSLSGPA
jgi:hypothetical protein